MREFSFKIVTTNPKVIFKEFESNCSFSREIVIECSPEEVFEYLFADLSY